MLSPAVTRKIQPTCSIRCRESGREPKALFGLDAAGACRVDGGDWRAGVAGKADWRKLSIINELQRLSEITTFPNRCGRDWRRGLAGGPARDCAGLSSRWMGRSATWCKRPARRRRRSRRSGCRRGTAAKPATGAKRTPQTESTAQARSGRDGPGDHLRFQPGGLRRQLPVLPDGQAWVSSAT